MAHRREVLASLIFESRFDAVGINAFIWHRRNINHLSHQDTLTCVCYMVAGLYESGAKPAYGAKVKGGFAVYEQYASLSTKELIRKMLAGSNWLRDEDSFWSNLWFWNPDIREPWPTTYIDAEGNGARCYVPEHWLGRRAMRYKSKQR